MKLSEIKKLYEDESTRDMIESADFFAVKFNEVKE